MHFTKRKYTMERDNNGKGINETDTKKMASKWQTRWWQMHIAQTYRIATDKEEIMVYFCSIFSFTNSLLNSTNLKLPTLMDNVLPIARRNNVFQKKALVLWKKLSHLQPRYPDSLVFVVCFVKEYVTLADDSSMKYLEDECRPFSWSPLMELLRLWWGM